MIKLLPITKRLKQLIKGFGDEWEIIAYRLNVPCFQDEGWLVESLCKKHRRWCRKEEIELWLNKGIGNLSLRDQEE